MNVERLLSAAELLRQHNWKGHREASAGLPGWDYSKLVTISDSCGTHCCAAGLLALRGFAGLEARLGRNPDCRSQMMMTELWLGGELVWRWNVWPSPDFGDWVEALSEVFEIPTRVAEVVFCELHEWKCAADEGEPAAMESVTPEIVIAALEEIARTGRLEALPGSEAEGNFLRTVG